ncbi:MAG: FAD-dependent oxidoreductase [Lachnospiraceae bacterium]|jgi:formate dehydrogenase major subunit|nr:FAD-dependent oxidoreductase [Lachnospiraceae bacterium]
MDYLRLNLDGREVRALPGQTILEVARENDVSIPTFCYDERTQMYGGCGLCMVEVEGNPKLLKACVTEIAPNMVIKTRTERVLHARKMNLELVLSNHTGDCRPPCVLGCPAQTDCQGYVGLIANGEYDLALELIKDKIPLPAAIGRVCPHPCEDNCRRKLVEEPVSIAWLKRFAADRDLAGGDPFVPEVGPSTGKSVGVIGAGPYGLSVAYFLRRMGHDVSIYEAMPEAGGMLRYGIPQYRLPKEVLDEEIDVIERMGVEIYTDMKVGEDIAFDTIREEHDAVCIGIGAWVSTGVGCKGEDARGVIGGIDFLRKVVRGEEIALGNNVAIVGGGNTAMDACRTAVRLGAKKVYNIYRRTKDEMPADAVEIEEAEEEGVIFKNLRNPIEVIKDDKGHVKQALLQVMELGEPDASGRRAPVPVDGKTETLDIDTMILAIGQAVNPEGFGGVDLTRRKGIVYDKDTFMTSMEGVFAGGDCGNDKVSIAIEAIADAKKSSLVIDRYLAGDKVKYRNPYVVTRDDITEKTFEDRERQTRPKMGMLAPDVRRGNFAEVVAGYSPEAARVEASRCLECGCHDYFECKLIDYGQRHDVHPERFAGKKNLTEFEDDHPFIVRDPNKCILCGLCVRVCDQVIGVSALGLVHRGFETIVMPAWEQPLAATGCISCGQCVSVCPTGALQERTNYRKGVPLDTETLGTTCPYCGAGCSLELETYGNYPVKANPAKDGAVNRGLCCGRGKFGFDCELSQGRLDASLVKEQGKMKEVADDDAAELVAKKLRETADKYGEGAVGVAVSDRLTNEDAYAVMKWASLLGARVFCFNNRASGLGKTLGLNASPNTIDELISTEYILVAGLRMEDNPIVKWRIREAAMSGAKVAWINPIGYEQRFDFPVDAVYTANDLGFLKQILRAVVDAKPGALEKLENASRTQQASGFAQSLANIAAGAQAAAIAAGYLKAKKAMIVFAQNFVTVDTAALLCDIALISGHIGSPRDGILQVKAKNNSQGLADLGILRGAEAADGVKALMVFGEDPGKLPGGLEFLAVADTHVTETAKKADAVIRMGAFLSATGTYFNTERRLMPAMGAADESEGACPWEIASTLAGADGSDLGFEDVGDIMSEMDSIIPAYSLAEVGQTTGGALAPYNPQLLMPEGDVFADPLPCTDYLMNVISARLEEVTAK